MSRYIIAFMAYLMGSIPFGLILTSINGIDIKKVGSSNIGATNVLRTGSKKTAIATLLLDSLKGFIIVFIVQNIYNDTYYTSLVGIASVLGHIFPVWLKFKGGKGIATTIGVLLGLNIYVGTAFILIWVTTFAIFRYSSLASLTATIASAVISLFYFKSVSITLIVVTPLIIIRHYDNIIKLAQGREHKFCMKKST